MKRKIYLDILNKERQQIFERLSDLLGEKYYLAGGTALALQLRHRESFDFDLFRKGEVSFGLKRKLLSSFKNCSIQTLVDTSDELTLVLNDEVKVSLINYFWDPIFPLVKLPKMIPLLSMKDIAATKAYALGRRGGYRDYFDLYVILKKGYATLKELVKWCQKKYGEVFSERMFLEQLSYLKDIPFDDELRFLDEKHVSLKQLEAFFKKEIMKSAKNKQIEREDLDV